MTAVVGFRRTFRDRFLLFFAHQKLLGRTEIYANSLEEGLTVNVNSLRHLPRQSSKNCDIQFANADGIDFNKIAIQETPRMAADKEAVSSSRPFQV